ncbi:MAG: BON domain-containing protein [Acidobacteriaceae bacterium]|nr:BON domain-containing protein [Acidobacteriaceae bacterium]
MLKVYRLLTFAALIAGLMLTPARAAQTGASGPDAQIQADVQKALGGKRFKDVKVSSQNGVVTLSGTVAVYADKQEADKKAQRNKNAQSVENEIVVAGPAVDDNVLADKLARKIIFDRRDNSDVVFEAIHTSVKDGVVTLSGFAVNPSNKDYVVTAVANYPGVKDVIDHIEVVPQSRFDDRIRADARQAIYGARSLNRYYIDPAKPIRIIVVNGNLTLYGTVATQSDKDVANIQANTVPGVFKVVNNLQVAGAAPEK